MSQFLIKDKVKIELLNYLRTPRSNALPLSLRDSTVSEVYYEVHVTRVLMSIAS